MSGDKRDILDVLKFELKFIEDGGYGRSVRTPWRPTSIFQDSLSCINFDKPDRPAPCSECMLMDFVPEDSRAQTVPCHHIPLNHRGETVHSMERQRTQVELEEALGSWLKSVIARIEEQRAAKPEEAKAH